MLIGIIFARGGSKGIPKKNIRMLGDMTLLERSIETLAGAEIVDKIYVSSDNDEILELAISSHVHPIVRPKALATDESPEFLSWKHAVDYIETDVGIGQFTFVSTPTTCPFRTEEDIKSVIATQRLHQNGISLGIVPAARNPHFNQMRKNIDGTLRVVMPLHGSGMRRQDFPIYWDVTTCAYCCDSNIIKSHSAIDKIPLYGAEVSEFCRFDLDTEEDWNIAEALQKGM